MVVVEPVIVRPVKLGLDVVVRFWLSVALPNRVRILLLPLMVMPLMVELFKVAPEDKRPEIVEVATVEVEMAEEIRELVPVRVVLPPCRVKVLLFRLRVPPSIVVVDTHCVPVPVDWSILPNVPLALLASNSAPVSLMFPATDSNWAGAVVPMPTLPLARTVK